MTITTQSSPTARPRTFEIVDKIPPGFTVWNIGAHMGTPEYIPLCQPADTGIRNIRTDTLKAIKLKPAEVMTLRAAAGYGVDSKSAAQKAINRPAKSAMQKQKKQLAERALPIFERITA